MNFEEIYKIVPKPHIPEKLPVELSEVLYDCEIIKLISKANNAMGAYRGFLLNTINPMLLIAPLMSQEAVLSSKLEGTHATIEDFINYDAGNEVHVSKDEMQEVMNKLKSADEDAKVAVKLKEEMFEELNFINAHQKQVELLLTNPFDKR